MAAMTAEEAQRRRGRQRLLRGVVLGGLAIGLPALANRWIAKRAQALPAATWGRCRRFLWRGGGVSFQRLGEGPPVVLLHSLGPGHDSAEWRRVAEQLAPKLQLWVPDLPGWGRSADANWQLSGQLYQQFLADFLSDVVRQPATVIGAGNAANHAVLVAHDDPERIRSLLLVAPTGLDRRAGPAAPGERLIPLLLGLPVIGTSALNLSTTRNALARYLQQDVYAAPERVDAALVEHHYRSSHLPGAQRSLAALWSGDLRTSVRGRLAALDCPVALGWGRHARSPALEKADLWLKRLPRARLEVFEGSAQLPHAEEPEAFCRWVEETLADLA